MRRNSRSLDDLIPLDLEINATLRRLAAEKRAREFQSTMAGGDQQIPKTLLEYSMPSIGSTSAIQPPPLAGGNFELKPSLVTWIQQDQFSGAPMENPIEHLDSFLEKCDTFNVNGVPKESIRMRLFSFSLRDKA